MVSGPRISAGLPSTGQLSPLDSNSKDSSSSLGGVLHSFLTASHVTRWARILAPLDDEVLQELAPNKADSMAVLVRSSKEISPSNRMLAARKLAAALFPALEQHQKEFDGDRASVHIVGPDEMQRIARRERESLFPDAPLNLNVELFRRELALKYHSLGAYLERATIYTVRLGDINYHLATVVGDLRPHGWRQYNEWRQHIKSAFGVDLRLVYEARPSNQHVPTVLTWDLRHPKEQDQPKGIVKFSEPGRLNLLPKRWSEFAVDWRQKLFISMDGLETDVSEDIMSAYHLKDGSIKLLVCVPFQISGSSRFSLGHETMSIGGEFLLDKVGMPAATKVSLAAAQNRVSIDTDTISHVLARSRSRTAWQGDFSDFPSPPTDAIRIVEEDWNTNEQISAFSDAARRILNWQIMKGLPVQTDLSMEAVVDLLDKTVANTLNGSVAPEMRPLPSLPRIKRGELVVSEIINFAQRQLTTWALHQDECVPLLVLRPKYEFGANIAEFVSRFPWLKDYDLRHLESRNQATLRIANQGSTAELVSFLSVMQAAGSKSEVVVVSAPDEMQPEDMTRFKPAHRPVLGQANQIQIAGLMLGTPTIPIETLQRMADVLNLPLDERRKVIDGVSSCVLKYRARAKEAYSTIIN